MSDDKLTITFDCKACGASPAILELPDHHTDDSIAKCKGCGHEFGRFGDIKGAARKAAAEHMKGALLDRLKGTNGWKINN